MEEIELLAQFKVDRRRKPKDFGEPIHSQLHHFVDASKDAYRTVTYIRLVNC